MDLLIQKRTVELLYNMMLKKGGAEPVVEYSPAKERFVEAPIRCPFPRATPESQGISSAYLEEFLEEFVQDPTIHGHGLLVLRHGKVILESHVYPRRPEIWHVTHSLCKSITGMAIGMLVEEGGLSLEERLVDIFPDYVWKISLTRIKDLTVRHLLTMTSGIVFNEAGAVTEKNWISAFMESGFQFEPGSDFHYNSMNSYMLSAILQRKTGLTLTEYLEPRLFTPLGIGPVSWECCPMGIVKGGWGMYLRMEDMAKLGQLILQRGKWDGVSLLPESWIDEMTSCQAYTPEEISLWGYGYHGWIGCRPGSFLFNGLFGQNVYIFPDVDVVLVTTAGSHDFFDNGRVGKLVQKYWGNDYQPEEALPEDPIAQEHLRKQVQMLEQPPKVRYRRKRDRLCRQLSGQMYQLEGGRAGFLPLVVQAMNNNFCKGINEIGFLQYRERFYLILREGDEMRRIELGLDQAVEQMLEVRGEYYMLAARAEYAEDEDDTPVLKIHLHFPELSNDREIKVFILSEERIRVRLREFPGLEMIEACIGMVLDAGEKNALMKKISEKADSELVDLALQHMIEPEYKGVRSRVFQVEDET